MGPDDAVEAAAHERAWAGSEVDVAKHVPTMTSRGWAMSSWSRRGGACPMGPDDAVEAVVRARCSAGTVWYFRSSMRKVISGRQDPAAVPAGSVVAAGSRCIVRVRGSVAERRKTETTINLG